MSETKYILKEEFMYYCRSVLQNVMFYNWYQSETKYILKEKIMYPCRSVLQNVMFYNWYQSEKKYPKEGLYV
jgi:hypothetical protein